MLDSFQTADPTRTFGEKLTIKKVMEDSYEKLKKNPLDDHSLNAELYNTIAEAFFGMTSVDLASQAVNHGLEEIEKSPSLDPIVHVKLLIGRAKGYSARKDYLVALQSLEVALTICKKNKLLEVCPVDEIYLYMAENQHNNGNMLIAKKHINKSLKWMQTRNIGGLRYALKLLFMAVLENSIQQPEEALIHLAELRSIISLKSKEESYYYLEAELRAGEALIKLEKYNEAEVKISKSIELLELNFGKINGLYTYALSTKGLLYVGLGKYDDSINLFKENIQIKKLLKINYAFDYNKMGNIYYHKIQDYELALRNYSEAVRLDGLSKSNSTSESGFYKRNLGFAYYKNNDNVLALKYLKESKVIFESLIDRSNYPVTLKGLNEWVEYFEQVALEKK
ncbi:MAG: hypothetical protein JKY19_13240 [Alcanivoracaceae bacterium]|nr:hypothetical protein [Alcanivoracaceae bacterium]